MASSATTQLNKWMHGDDSHYDEMLAPDGQFRPSYTAIMSAFQEIADQKPKRVKKFISMSLKAFNGDNTLYQIPRMLSQTEYTILYTGVQQRARALQLFLDDHYSKHRSYLRILSKKNINQIIARSCEAKFQKKVDRYGIKQYGFWYGPDIIRGPNGDFYVCEDNIGFVGGFGDRVLARKILLKGFPEYRPCIQKQSVKNVYQEMVDSYRRMIKPDEQIVILYYPRSMSADHEEKRIIHHFKALNVHCVILPYGKKLKKDSWNLEVDSHRRVFIVKGNIRLPVGLVILDCEAHDIDPKNSTIHKQFIFSEAESYLELYSDMMNQFYKKGSKKYKKFEAQYKKLAKIVDTTRASPDKKNFRNLNSFLKKYHRKDFNTVLSYGIPGLLRAYFEGKIKLINGPGVDFLGDKLFYPHLDALIRHYLKEEPILQTIPTMSFSEFPELITAVFDNPAIQQHIVIKSTNGRGGSQVWVGPKISRSKFLAIKDRIRRNPSQFLVQQYMPLSQVNNQLVDLRVICSVSSADIVVLPTFWGRGVPAKKSNGKVNISDKGFEFAVCQAKN